MTGQEPSPAPSQAAEHPESDERLRRLLTVDVASSGRRRQPQGVARSRRWQSPGILVALLCTGVILVGLGTRLVANSTNGRLVAPVGDADSPGFEALVDPTPTLALVTVDGDDLIGIDVLTLPQPHGSGGGVVIVPQRTIGDLPLFGENPLETSFELGDDRSLVDALGVVLDTGIAERAVVDDDRWAELVAPVAPITVDNPNALYLDGDLVFEVGEQDLEPEDVGRFLRATADDDEGDLGRLFRHVLFFTAWFDAVAAHGGVDAVPGELDSGIGRFVRTIAGGPVDIATLPVEIDESEDFGPEDTYEVASEQAADVLERMVPLPTSAEPGARPRVRVLNGTADLDQASHIAPMLPPAGVEVTVVGNAASLDAEATTVRYGGAAVADEARRIADILGVDDVEADALAGDSFDITVTLGPDAQGFS